MNGRMQNEMLIEKRNDEKVSLMPSFVQDWYINMKASKKTAATCRDYISKIEKFLKTINSDMSKISLSEINNRTISSYYLSIQHTEKDGELAYTSDSYQLSVWYCLDNFLTYLYKVGAIERNYMDTISKPKNHDLDRINEKRVLLTEKDFKKIVSVINMERNETLRKRDRAIVLLFMYTGMRKTALETITFDDIDLENASLTVVDKGNKRHTYVLNDVLVDALKEWIGVRSKYIDSKTENHVFVSNRGKIMAPKTLEKTIKKYTEKALGHPLSPHKLRSGYCSILYKKTGDIEFVRRAVGHSSAVTTQRYIVTNGTEKKKAAEIMGNLLT